MTEKSTGECEEKLSNMKLENGQSEIETEKNNTPATIPSKTFQENFKLFAKFGDPKSEGKHITLSNSDKWMKQAKIIDGKKITTTDTAIHFKKLKIQKVGINDYKKFLEDLANSKKIGMEEILNKLLECGPPGHHGVGTVKATSTVERLTDTSKYTGSHKQKFEEVGKGKGVAGKKDNPETPRTVNTKKN